MRFNATPAFSVSIATLGPIQVITEVHPPALIIAPAFEWAFLVCSCFEGATLPDLTLRDLATAKMLASDLSVPTAVAGWFKILGAFWIVGRYVGRCNRGVTAAVITRHVCRGIARHFPPFNGVRLGDGDTFVDFDNS
jgi:hypothetical protein